MELDDGLVCMGVRVLNIGELLVLVDGVVHLHAHGQVGAQGQGRSLCVWGGGYMSIVFYTPLVLLKFKLAQCDLVYYYTIYYNCL